MRLRAVTVDLWGTLFLDGPGADDSYRRTRLTDFETILGAAGAPAMPATLERAYDASAEFLGRLWRVNRDAPVAEHVNAILVAIDPDLPGRLPAAVHEELVEAYSRPALLEPPRVAEGALAALRALGARGYALAIVSNTMRTPGATLRELLERHGLLACFRHTTFSDEVGVRKPDPRIFQLTLEALASPAAAALHVGDDPLLDVAGARAAGMRVVQVTRRAAGALAPDAVIRGLAALPDAVARLDG